MGDYALTDKANFPESSAAASLNLAIALGLVIDFVDGIVKFANKDPEVVNLWDIAKGLQSASEVYFMAELKGTE
jgi:hypothetical protein